MEEIWVLNPTGVNRTESQAIAPRLKQLEGVRLGLLNNNKPNSQMLQQHIVDLLSEQMELGAVIKKQKFIPSIGAEGLVEYASEVDAVITAIGD